MGHLLPMAFNTHRTETRITLIMIGAVTLEDLYAGVDALYDPDPPPQVIWDFSSANVDQEPDSSEKLRAFSAYATERGKDRAGSKVALVAPKDIHFGMSRMSTSFAQLNQAAYDMQVFRTLEEAEEWFEAE